MKVTHGESRRRARSAEYKVWCSMIRRCHTPGASGYYKYGAKGIVVCQRWRESYEAFLEDMGRRPNDEYSIDRIDPRGNYEPENTRWIENRRQAQNRTTCVLNETQVREIKAALATPYRNIGADLGRKYGVSRYIVSAIKTGRSWANI